MVLILSLVIALMSFLMCFILFKYVLPYNKNKIYRSKKGAWTTFVYDPNLTLVEIVNPNPNITVKLKNHESIIGHNINDLCDDAIPLNRKAARVIVPKIIEVSRTKAPIYFECPFYLEEDIIFALCYIESVDDGYIYFHAIEINVKQLVAGRREFIDKALTNGMDNIAAGIYTKQYVNDDPRGYRYITFNKRAKELFEDKNITKSQYWDQKEEDERDIQVVQSGIAQHYEHPIRNEAGEIIKWLGIVKHRVASMADYQYVITTVFDITSIKDKELENQKEKERAEQSDKFKSAFLANMSHEIRTPLNAIVGFSRLLPFVDSEEERDEFTNIINTNNDLLLKLIEDILDLSKIEAGYITINKQEFNLSGVLSDLQKMFSLRAKDGVVVLCDFPTNSSIVNLDKNRTIQVVTNFLSNSIKFTNTGYIKIGYNLAGNNNGLNENGIEIYVEDTGKGIAQENIPRVFDRFEKFDQHVQGTGLGMAICKSIVDANNGKVWVESTLGKGTTFHVYIPNCVV